MPNNINQWLKDLGLSKYEKNFSDNDIELDVLADLTDDDLKELGISLGDRKRIINAANAVEQRTHVSSILDSTPISSQVERRQLTVCFCDLVGSTALSTKLDPEDLRSVVSAYQDVCVKAVERYSGYIAKFMGDGVLIYFGFPHAHEDNAERAVRAGLEIVENVKDIRISGIRETNLAARIGIATGTVVVGDLIGEGASQEAAILGETPNLAARIQENTQSNTVAIGATTRRLIGSAFVCKDLGEEIFKGFDKPINIWVVERSRRSETRFDARQPEKLTELVGRDEEINTLLRRWEQAKQGDGQVVLISGEPGIGKSRLAQALQEHIVDDPHRPYRLQCSPYHTTSTLYPVINQYERLLGFTPGDTDATKLEKLESMLSEGGSVDKFAPILAHMLSIETGDRYAPLDLNPSEVKEVTLKFLAARFIELSRMLPMLFIFEDVQWIDPSTLELLEMMVENAAQVEHLIIITFRPEFAAPWVGRPRVTSMILNRLDSRFGTTMIENTANNKVLPKELLDQIIAKTDGVPLFVEELTKSVIESGILKEEDDRFLLTGPLPLLAIPETLQDSLMARFDRLSPIKETAQIGSVIGREFPFRLIAAVSPLNNQELQKALDQLVDAGLILRRGADLDDMTYQFKHALVQDTAYGSLLRSRLRELHEKVARSLEEDKFSSSETEPEILAQHFTKAEKYEEAIRYWVKAGTISADRSANAEAITQFGKAVEIMNVLPESVEKNKQELEVQISLFSPLMVSAGYHSPELFNAQTRALELSEKLNDTSRILPVLHSRYTYYQASGKPVEALEYAEEYLRLAKLSDDQTMHMIGHRAVGASIWHLGNLELAREHIEKTLSFYDPKVHTDLTAIYGQDINVTAHMVHSVILWSLGFSEKALETMNAGLEYARSIDHPESLAFILGHSALILNFIAGNTSLAKKCVGELNTVTSDRHSGEMWRGDMLQFHIGLMRFVEGNKTEGLEEMRDAIGPPDEIKLKFLIPAHIVVLAQVLVQIGDTNLAMSYLDTAQQITDASEDRWSEAEIHRTRGDALVRIHKGYHAEAEASYLRAIEVARLQEAKKFELRAATSLSRLWFEQGMRDKAQNLLTPVYSWFTEGFDTTDLFEAKALLDEMS